MGLSSYKRIFCRWVDGCGKRCWITWLTRSRSEASVDNGVITSPDLRQKLQTPLPMPKGTRSSYSKWLRLLWGPYKNAPLIRGTTFLFCASQKKSMNSSMCVLQVIVQGTHEAEARKMVSVLEDGWAKPHGELLPGTRPAGAQATRAPTSWVPGSASPR